MKQVFLKKMTLTNFRCHKDLEVNFSDHTTVSGDNKLGKSTVFDGFVWTLFGKDQFDRQNHEIIPIVEGKRLDRVDPEVTVDLIVDGRELSLKRVLHQKWVRRRGTAEEVFDGCDTLYYMNDVPLKASEYKGRVDMIIEETIFKMITNPATFLGLHWTKQREFLFQIAGTISDAEVAAAKPKFAQLLELVNGKSLIEFKKEIYTRKKKLNDDLADIHPKIDQTTRLMPESKDFAGIVKQIAETDEAIKAIDLQLSDRSAAIRGQYEDMQAKQRQINTLKTKQNEAVNEAKKQATQEAFEKNQKRSEVENSLKAADRNAENSANEIRQLEKGVQAMQQSLTVKNAEIQKLRDSWTTENEKAYKAKDGCLICPVFGSACGDDQAIEKHATASEKAVTAFFEAKETTLQRIENTGIELGKELQEISSRINQRSAELEAEKLKSVELLNEVSKLKAALALTQTEQPRPIYYADIPELSIIENHIRNIEASMKEVQTVDNLDLTGRKGELVIKRDQLKKDLDDKDRIAKFRQEVVNLTQQGADLAQQIADLEKLEFTMDEFNKAKINECDRRINGLFQIVRFQLFDKTIDGNEFETCIATNKVGVPISATNTAEKINAGLDIIATLSKFYNVSAPVFLDGSESVNNYFNTKCQMVFLKVTKEPVLTISNT